MSPRSSGLVQWVLSGGLALGLGGCAGLTGSLYGSAQPPGQAPSPASSSQTAAFGPAGLSPERAGPDLTVLAMALDARDRSPSFLPSAVDDALDLTWWQPRDPWAVPEIRISPRPSILFAAADDPFDLAPHLASDSWAPLDRRRPTVLASAGALLDRPRRRPADPWALSDVRVEPRLSFLREARGILVIAQQREASPPPIEEIEEYDPWEPFNEAMFEFNRTLDRWVLKPTAKGYNFILPAEVQQLIANGFDNIAFVPRFVNSLLQGKFRGAGRELARFVINSTAGVGGLFDVAKREFNLRPSDEDTGQTLAVWGVGPGPYLVLPFLPPLTVRDAIGFVADGAMDPLNYLLPFVWARVGMKTGDTLNDRALNLDLFQGFEETTIDFYSAVRNAYLQRRLKTISE